MKRILVTFFTVAAFCLASFAQKYTNLAIEALFDGRYHDNPNTSVSVIKNPGTVFRSLKVSGNSRIVGEMERLLRKDMEKCTNTIETYENGVYELIFNSGGANIGFTKKGKSDAELWMNSTDSSSGRRKTSKASSKSKKTSSKPQVIINGREVKPTKDGNYRCYAYNYASGNGYGYDYTCNNGKAEFSLDLSGLASLEDMDFSSLENLDLSGLDSLKDLDIELSGLEDELSSMGDAIRKDVKKALSKSFKKKAGDSNKR